MSTTKEKMLGDVKESRSFMKRMMNRKGIIAEP